jgi:hypothetical protein
MELFSVYQLRGARHSESLHCVWVETGNSAQPLACVWVDPAASEASGSNREAAAAGEDHLGMLGA